MKRTSLIFTATIIACFIPSICFAEGKIYTRKAKLADFCERTVKVVLTGNQEIDNALKEEVAACWRISPYEFCGKEEFERYSQDNAYYTLNLKDRDGILFLHLDKGGKENDANPFKRPFEVVSIPAFPTDNPTQRELLYLAAWLDIIQSFTLDAMNSDSKAYTGLVSSNISNLNGKTAVTDPAECEKSFRACETDTVVGIIVAPRDAHDGGDCYKFLVTCDTHELYYFKKHKIGPRAGAEFLKSDLLRIFGIGLGKK